MTDTLPQYCVAVGFNALLVNSSGASNVAIGVNALDANTVGASNIAMGNNALGSNISGDNNTAIGHAALILNTASNNTAIGFQALNLNVSTVFNTAVGVNALKVNIANSNTAMGYNALDANTTGTQNTGIGVLALSAIVGGVDCTSVGYQALSLATGSSNTAVGSNTLRNVVTGVGNVAIGDFAGNDVTGSGNVLIGTRVADGQVAISNQLWLDNTNTSTPLIYGEFDNDLIVINGTLAVGTYTPDSLFEVDGAEGLAIETVTGNTTLDKTHSTLLVNASGNVVITLPTAASAFNNTDGIGRIYNVKKIDADADTVTLDGASSETIDDDTTQVLITQYQSLKIQSDGTQWFIL